MLRQDESAAWTRFLAAAPNFANEAISSWADGPDPPDIMCTGATGRRIGVELTKWVEHKQVTDRRGRQLLEGSYLAIIASEREPRPAHIGIVHLHDKSVKMKQTDTAQFRAELFDFLRRENAKPAPSLNPPLPIPQGYWNTARGWDNPQGAPISDFAGFPMLKKYLADIWIFPRSGRQHIPSGRWVLFESPGGRYTPDWMVQAAVARIQAKIAKYAHENLRAGQSLAEFDLVCFYCDEALLHNTPIEAVGFGFPDLAGKVKQALGNAPAVFDRIFLFHPYEAIPTVQVYGK